MVYICILLKMGIKYICHLKNWTVSPTLSLLKQNKTDKQTNRKATKVQDPGNILNLGKCDTHPVGLKNWTPNSYFGWTRHRQISCFSIQHGQISDLRTRTKRTTSWGLHKSLLLLQVSVYGWEIRTTKLGKLALPSSQPVTKAKDGKEPGSGARRADSHSGFFSWRTPCNLRLGTCPPSWCTAGTLMEVPFDHCFLFCTSAFCSSWFSSLVVVENTILERLWKNTSETLQIWKYFY